jgi:hypothetical protein
VTKFLTLLTGILLISEISLGSEIKLSMWSGRIDTDSLFQLNAIANELFPTSGSFPTLAEQIAAPDAQSKYKSLVENVSAFVKTKGFYLVTPPAHNYSNYGNGGAEYNQAQIQNAFSTLPEIHPLIERALLDRLVSITGEYFKPATSDTAFKVVDNLIVFIPIFGALYGAKRIMDPSFGPIGSAQSDQKNEYEIMQKCAYMDSFLEVSKQRCIYNYWEGEDDKRRAIATYKEMLDYAFISNFLLQLKLYRSNCTGHEFALSNYYSKQVFDQVMSGFDKYRLPPGWLYPVLQNTAETSRRVSLCNQESNKREFIQFQKLQIPSENYYNNNQLNNERN